MVKIFNDDIVKAFTGGESVKAIYSQGVQVWPTSILPDGYKQLNWIMSRPGIKKNGTLVSESPYIILLDLPFNVGDLTVEVDFQTNAHYIGYDYLVVSYNKSRSYSRRYKIDWAATNNQTDTMHFVDSFTKTNVTSYRLNKAGQKCTVIQKIPHNQLNTKTWINGVEYIESNVSPKENIEYDRLCLNIGGDEGGDYCSHLIFRARIKDINGNVLYDLIPAKRLEDGEVGMYDIVRDVFVGNHEPIYTDTDVLPFIYE